MNRYKIIWHYNVMTAMMVTVILLKKKILLLPCLPRVYTRIIHINKDDHTAVVPSILVQTT